MEALIKNINWGFLFQGISAISTLILALLAYLTYKRVKQQYFLESDSELTDHMKQWIRANKAVDKLKEYKEKGYSKERLQGLLFIALANMFTSSGSNQKYKKVIDELKW